MSEYLTTEIQTTYAKIQTEGNSDFRQFVGLLNQNVVYVLAQFKFGLFAFGFQTVSKIRTVWEWN